ncbi:MAG TPA: hypothetical protein VNI01_11235 [Elusimicrobiota bacterium]|jgi:hypothetical protein|nr:hypothetical protein [Elusimicrobiota bacterium]
MSNNAINNLALDGSSARIRLHLSIFGGIEKITGIEEKLKQEKVVFLGERYATARTPGIVEVSDIEIVMSSIGWAALVGALPDQFSEIDFPITCNERHVQLATGYTVLLDQVQIIGTKQDIEASEKMRRVTIPASVMRIAHKGSDGVKKTLARRPGVSPLVSPAGQALGF